MRNKLLMLVLIILLLAVSVPQSLSYFFTYTKASGTVTVDLSDDSYIDECVTGNVKDVTITAKDNSDPVFVRVLVFKAPDITVTYQGEGWEADGDYYYYYMPIDGFDGDPFTDNAEISFTVLMNSQNEYAEDETRHVVVVYEGTPALFSTTVPQADRYWTQKDSDDNIIGYWYADWNTVLPEVGEGD